MDLSSIEGFINRVQILGLDHEHSHSKTSIRAECAAARGDPVNPLGDLVAGDGKCPRHRSKS